jgi:N-acetylneuraminic acid mutarotase
VISSVLFAAGGKRGALLDIIAEIGQLASVEIYSPVSNQWKQHADMPEADYGVAVASLGNALYVVGMKAHAKYDMVSEEWRQIAPLNEPRFGLALVKLNGSLYAFGGNGDAEFRRSMNRRAVSTVEHYDAQRNAWMTVARLRVARGHVAGCVWRVRASDHAHR